MKLPMAALLTAWLALAPAPVLAGPGPIPYGGVVMNNYSMEAGFAPVVFDHWLHRARFTCRLCHVDIGFAMKAGATKVSAATNIEGYYCGTCHDGKRSFQGRTVFKACSEKFAEEDRGRCLRCHHLGKEVAKQYDFEKFKEAMPKTFGGRVIDWEEAEARGLVKPVDFLEGVSVKRPPLTMDKDVSLEATATWMSDVLFSHKKHAVWNGCEVCHPGIYPSTKGGTVKYSMIQIADGESCGVCHGKVAFPVIDCARCHTKPVR